jgi:FtsP/CotA-like multicopper oxidase with cupredoxin domain
MSSVTSVSTPNLTDAILYPPPALPPQPGRVRKFDIVVAETQYEVAAGKFITAWAFNGSIPGPTLRVTQGDVVEATFHNKSTMAHSIHFHGIHGSTVDGTDPMVLPGQSFTYRFEAQPWGLFVYHCHAGPVEAHLNHGMYGTFIIDPPVARSKARELVMLMNGYDLEEKEKGENQFYSVNGPAGYYQRFPIPLKVGEPVRVYLANMTEFDPINSFHLHANVFQVVPSVMATQPTHWDDTVMLCQGQRSIVEFTFTMPGKFMFHAHQSDISTKGWSGLFHVS